MRANFAFRCLLSAVCCCSIVLPLAGCGSDAAPVQTTGDDIDQYLQENPDEAYSSDGIVEQMEEDDGAG